jgi:hypothetical protein
VELHALANSWGALIPVGMYDVGYVAMLMSKLSQEVGNSSIISRQRDPLAMTTPIGRREEQCKSQKATVVIR